MLWDELPEPVAPTDNDAWSEGFDAMFQIGFHAWGRDGERIRRPYDGAGSARGGRRRTGGRVPNLGLAGRTSPSLRCSEQDPGKLQRFRSFFEDWVGADEPAWQS